MFTPPDVGWTNFQIGDFIGRASYLTDVPVATLEALILGFQKRVPSTIFMDGEGPTYLLVIHHHDTYVIEKDDGETLHSFRVDRRHLALEIVRDIERDFELWVDWELEREESVLADRRSQLRTLVEQMKQILRTEPTAGGIIYLSPERREQLGLVDDEQYRNYVTQYNAPVLRVEDTEAD